MKLGKIICKTAGFLVKWSLIAHFTVTFSMLLSGVYNSIFHKPKDLNEYVLAENLNEYFNYISNTPVGKDSDVHLTVPVQMALQQQGYSIGVCGADGVPGKNFAEAISSFQIDNGLRVTGEGDVKTLKKLFNKVLQNPGQSRRIEVALIQPYNTSEAKKFMNNVESIYDNWWLSAAIFVRPDIMYNAVLYHGVFGNSMRWSIANHLYPGCANNHLKDSFRHTSTAVAIASAPTSNEFWAKLILNLREISTDNPLPIKWMDMYNHDRAADLYSAMHANGENVDTSYHVILEAIQRNKFAIYPLPLIKRY